MRYAAFDSSAPAPQPITAWYDTELSAAPLPAAQNLLPLTDAEWAERMSQPWAAQAGALVPYTPPVVPPTLAQQAAAMLNAGCVIASTASPGVNGTYAVDPASRATLAEIVAGINAGDGLPGGGDGFIYDDASGAHTFAAAGTITAAAQVIAVGKGLRDFVYAANQVIQNRTTVVPVQPWPIP